MTFLTIDWPHFVYLLVDLGFLFPLPLKFLLSIALRSMDATDRHSAQGQTDRQTQGRVSLSVCVS